MMMFEGTEIHNSIENLSNLKGKKPLFICTIATTDTAKIPNITGAGISPDFMEYTPAGDVELIVHGNVHCCDIPPETTIGDASAPTPAMITKGVLELTNVPYLIVDAGSKIKPDVPYMYIDEGYGKDIRTGKAVKNPEKIFNKSKLIAKELSKSHDYLVIGESIPGGTTTALSVLTALGYDANFKVSGSIPKNPHDLKKKTVLEGIANANLEKGIGNIGKNDPFKCISAVGDPMIPSVAGMVIGSEAPVILGGGTQMAAVCSFIKAIEPDFDFSKIILGTTTYVVNDKSSDLLDIINQIGDIGVIAIDPEFEKSNNPGLKNYLKGFVKEGVGAGGSLLMGILLGYSIDDIREKIEEVCD